MKTESHYDYKGYRVRLTYARCNGARYDIMKIIGGKWFGLRTENWNFVDPLKLEQRAFNYIDNFPDRLEAKFQKRYAEWEERMKRTNPESEVLKTAQSILSTPLIIE